MYILLVDNSLDASQRLSQLLSFHGYDVATAGSLTAARELCQNGHFDFLISDLRLHDGDGCQLVELAHKCGTKAIALTDPGDSADQQRAQEAGFCAHWLKPVTFEQIEKTFASPECSVAFLRQL